MKILEKIALLLAILSSIVGYYFLNYRLDRSEYIYLFGFVAVLFVFYYVLIKISYVIRGFWLWMIIAIIFRVTSLFSLPNLSDDYYRFLWDGQLTNQGINPYDFKPSEIDTIILQEDQKALLNQMNSPNYYSVYPPVLQVVFKLSANNEMKLSHEVLLLKIVTLLFEIIGLIFLYKLLQIFNMKITYWLGFAFNPLVIIEISGNLHFEGMMITFLIMTIYYYLKENYWLTGTFFGIAVLIKLTPLMLVPFILLRTKPKDSLFILVTFALSVASLSFYWIDLERIDHISKSLDLYFHTFEFNASIYYLLRELGYWFYGYNMIGFVGTILAITSFLSILLISFIGRRSGNIFEVIVLIFFIHSLLSSIVHPWYILPVLFFGVMSKKFQMTGIVWSCLVFVSYYTYKDSSYTENSWLVFIEYGLVLSIFIFEIFDWKISDKSIFHSGSNRIRNT